MSNLGEISTKLSALFDVINDEEYNLMSKNFKKFFRRGGNFRRGNRFGNRGNNGRNNFGRGRGFDNKVGKALDVLKDATILVKRVTS